MSRTSRTSPEPWPWPGRPRVLIEQPDEAAGLELAATLRGAGYSVAVCPGPGEKERCPLAGPAGCAIAHGADIIVSGLGLERAETREVLKGLRDRCPDVPLVVEVGPGQDEEWPELLSGCELVHSPAAPEQVLSAVQRARARVS